MFGLTPITLYAIIGLLISNVAFIGLWQFADLRADKQEALVAKCQSDHKAFADQVASSGRIAQAQAKQKEAEHERIVEDTSKGWAAAIAVVRADAAKRVRLATSGSTGSSAMPGVSQDRPGNAQASPDTVPSPERVAADCAETTITLNYLQSYVERLQNE